MSAGTWRAKLSRSIETAIDAALKAQREGLLGDIRSALNEGRPPRKRRAPMTVTGAAPARRCKNPWAGLSPAARLARVNAIRKGRGLPAKSA